jgi:hypothetical protein
LANPSDFTDFDADIEFTLGDEILKINYPCYIFIPKETMYCPLDIKRVGKPFMFIDAQVLHRRLLYALRRLQRLPDLHISPKTTKRQSGGEYCGHDL